MAITASLLVETLVKADNIWADNAAKADYEANVDAARALIEQSTASINNKLHTTDDGDGKDHVVKVTWIDACVTDAEDCTDECDITGAELNTASKTYQITDCKKKGFSYNIHKFRTNTFGEAEFLAKGILSRAKSLDEAIAKAAVAAITANLGVNVYTGMGVVTGTNTAVSSALMDSMNVVPHYLIAAMRNKVTKPFLLSGTNSYIALWNADMNGGNADGKGDAARAKAIKTYFDIANVETLAANKSFLIDRGTFALGHKAYYDARPQEFVGNNVGQSRFSIESRNLPGVRYDVHTTLECVNGEFLKVVELRARFNWLHNPLGCTATRTGVYQFTKV